MAYLAIKALISGGIVALVSELAMRHPGWGGMLASLPLVSLLAWIWLWRETGAPLQVAAQARATFWFVLPSLPLFLLVPALLARGWGFWPSLALGCLVTVALYAAMVALAPRLGISL